jgi:hypothetical protein
MRRLGQDRRPPYLELDCTQPWRALPEESERRPARGEAQSRGGSISA